MKISDEAYKSYVKRCKKRKIKPSTKVALEKGPEPAPSWSGLNGKSGGAS